MPTEDRELLTELREHLDRYAADALSADALAEWLAAESWDMRRWVSLGAQRLVASIQALLIAHADGHLSDESLRDRLLPYLAQLHRARAVTQTIDAPRVGHHSVTRSQALILEMDVDD